MFRLTTTVLSNIEKNSKIFRKSTVLIFNKNLNELKRYQSSKIKYNESDGYINTSPYPTISIPEITLDKYIWNNINRWSNKIAMVCIVTGRKYTYGQLRDTSATFAFSLQHKFKLQQRDVIAVCLPNLPEYPIAILGAQEAGLTISLMNPIYPADEIARQLNMCNTKLIVCTPLNYHEITKACEIAKRNVPILCIPFLKEQKNPKNAINFFEIINARVDFNKIKENTLKSEDIAILPFSSGTTGLAKGVMLTHRNLISNCEMVQSKLPLKTFVEETTNSFQDVIPCFLPFFHIFGLMFGMMSKLHLGCQIVTLPTFKMENLILSLTEYKGSILNLVTPILLALTNMPNITSEHLKHLRFVIGGASPVGLMDVQRFLTKFPHVEFSQGFGMTETSPAVIVTPIGNKKHDSTGFPLSDTEIKFISYEDNELKGLPAYTSGELCVRGPQVMKGYLNNDEANADIFLPDGWLRSGDIGHYDDEGYVFITDRIKELIKVKGFQVPPAELEEILRSHPNLLDAAVFAIPNEKSGESPRAVVVPKPNKNVTEKDVMDFVAERVPSYKKLTGGVVFVKEIPKNAAGKILRRELKEKFTPK